MSGLSLRVWRWWRVDALGVAGCVVLTVLGLLIATGPGATEYRARDIQQTDLSSMQNQLSQAENELRKTDQQRLDVKQALNEYAIELKPVQQINRRLAELAGLAKPIGLKVDVIQPDQQILGDMYIRLPINFNGTASFPNCVRFLSRLRERFPDTAVADFYLTSRPGDMTGTARFQFKLIWYAQVPSDTDQSSDKQP